MWIVLMEKEKVMKEEAKKKKKGKWWMGGQNSTPTLKLQLSCWVNSQKKKFFSFYFLFFSIPRKKKNQNHIMEREKLKKKIKFSKKERMKNSWNELRIKLQNQIFKFFLNSKSQIFNSKFSFPSLKISPSRCPTQFLNSKSPKFQVVKISNLRFHVQNFKSQISKTSSFNFSKFQVSNLSKSKVFKVSIFKSSGLEFQVPNFKHQIPSFKKSNLFQRTIKKQSKFYWWKWKKLKSRIDKWKSHISKKQGNNKTLIS